MSALASDWLLEATGSRVKDFYQAIGVELRGEGQEASVRCFANGQAHAHGDRSPSCSVSLLTGLYKCHGCGQSGNAYNAALSLGYSERRAQELARSFGLFLEIAREDKPRLPDERQILKWRKALWADELILRRCWERLGWTRDAIRRYGVGWDGERLVFTIRDKRLKKIGVVRYLPGADRKVLSMPGSKRNLFPAPESLSRRRPVFLVEGEACAVSVRSCGLQAVGVPGAGSWRMEWAQRLGGFRVVGLADCDRQGRGLMEQAAGMLPGMRVVDIAPGREDGYDAGDLVAEAAREGAIGQVRRVLERVAE